MPKSIIYKWFKLIILINKPWLLLLNGRIDKFLTCADKSIVLPALLSFLLKCLILILIKLVFEFL